MANRKLDPGVGLKKIHSLVSLVLETLIMKKYGICNSNCADFMDVSGVQRNAIFQR